MNLKLFIRSNPKLLRLTQYSQRWLRPIYAQPITVWFEYIHFFNDWRHYRAMGGIAYLKDFYPCLTDRTQETPIDYQYFYQAVWAMTALCQMRPKQHIDVGSDIKFVGMLSTITQVIFVDIRPLQVKLPNFECCSGSITELPFEDNSCESLSSLHVIEHIGLGRYGDLIDPYGAEKACSELKRALSIGGRLYVSIPLGRARVQFNGHRIFATNEVLGLFSGLTLIQAALIDNHGNFLPTFNLDDVKFDEALGQEFALGCFIFQKGEI